MTLISAITFKTYLPYNQLANMKKNQTLANDAKGISILQNAIQSIRSVFFKYPGIHNYYILKNINLCIPKGKITAIVGASGSGKTTLLKLLLAFYEPQQGKIMFDDQDMTVTDTDDYRQNCGVVMQDGFIYNTSIAQNVAMQEKGIDKERVIDQKTLSDL
jgi:ABC-type bacteriocin/lantibiotic exporter with double-glycine peptidase domain